MASVNNYFTYSQWKICVLNLSSDHTQNDILMKNKVFKYKYFKSWWDCISHDDKWAQLLERKSNAVWTLIAVVCHWRCVLNIKHGPLGGMWSQHERTKTTIVLEVSPVQTKTFLWLGKSLLFFGFFFLIKRRKNPPVFFRESRRSSWRRFFRRKILSISSTKMLLKKKKGSSNATLFLTCKLYFSVQSNDKNRVCNRSKTSNIMYL